MINRYELTIFKGFQKSFPSLSLFIEAFLFALLGVHKYITVMIEEPTDRQMQVYRFIKYFISSNSYSPSLEDIANEFNFRKTAARKHLAALKKKSILNYTPRTARSIVLLK